VVGGGLRVELGGLTLIAGLAPAPSPLVPVAAARVDERQDHLKRGEFLATGGPGQHGRRVVAAFRQLTVRRLAGVRTKLP
jgi:hypothetical protein